MKNFKIPKNVLHLILLIIIPLISIQKVASQNISGKIFGQNAWMPYSIGTTTFNGKLDSLWNKVKNSHAKICRYGGIAVDKNMPTNTQYLNIIDSIRSNGMEPVMLVSFDNNKYTAAQAGQTVEFINIISNKNIKYWVIGNEPDNSYGYVNSAQVADYVKRFSLAMKQKDPSIKIIAPETAWYNQNILDGLITPGGVNDITGKDSSGNFIVDLISFHTFPFRGIQKRNEVISYLTEPYQFEYNLTQLNQKIAACNSFHQRNSNFTLRSAVTEANIDWQNPQGDGVFGVGANSFLAGQFWAEMIGICMKTNIDFINFWSIIEGNELGYLNHSTTLPKPSYYHFQMLADNFIGSYCKGIDNNTNIKSFGSKSGDHISVIILNQDQSNDFIYKLRLDTNLISGADPLKINIDAGTNIEYSDTSFRESSVVLIFNSSGTLIKKCVYKLYGNADQNIMPACNLETVSYLTTIISPAGNSFFILDSTINFFVTVSGGTGPIQKVEFFADSIKIGEDFTNPYSFAWNNALVGNHSLTVKATDSINNTAVSAIIYVTVVKPLTATITYPLSGSSFIEGTSITIQAATSNGTGIIQKVEFFADSIKLGEDLTSPYNISWNNASAGNYALTARATDSGNNTAVSEIINITVIIPLTATIISPSNNSDFYADSTITIVATTSGGTGPIQKVEFFSGTIKLSEDTIAPYNFIWNNITAGVYALTAKVTDSVNNNSVSEIINITVNPTVVNCIATGTIAREVWSNVSGSSVTSIPLSLSPSLTGQLTIFEAPQNFANYYGQRISGYICPPITGNYIFWIASDNDSELWLSTDSSPANKQKIASVSGYTSSRQWTKYASQKSISKNLIAGQNYYIEALHKESNQGDNCAVGWQLPSGVLERPIPGNRLSPFELIPSIQLISTGSSWKYLDNGTNQGTAWRATNFGDATWKTGNAELGYGDGGEATVVSYGPSSTNKYITTYFRKTFNVSDISTISGLELSLIRDDGAVVYINGVEVYRSNLPTGTIYYNTLAPSIIDKTMESTYVIANIGSSTLVNGTNHIAVEIHQNAITSPDISFNLKLRTLSGSRIMDNDITYDSTGENTILENTVEMIVYPNPTTGQFNLELCIDDLQKKNVVIEVTNSLGQVIYKKLPQKINGCIKETIELEPTLPTGIYIMHVTIDDKIQIAKMLLTQ